MGQARIACRWRSPRCWLATAAWAQDAKSAAGARELAGLLAQKKLDAVAARDPAAPDAFVAALHFPGQLLIISARYTAPPLLNEKLARREYRDVYIEIERRLGGRIAGVRHRHRRRRSQREAGQAR